MANKLRGELSKTLTKREKAVLSLVLSGLENKEISTRLGSQVATVRAQILEICRKLEVQSRSALLSLEVKRLRKIENWQDNQRY